MLRRDQYEQDPTLSYHPSFTKLEFVNLYSGLNPSISPYIPEPLTSIRTNSAINVYGSSALFLTGVAAAVFYKRIPWIRRFTSKTARVLWSAFFIFIPSGIYSAACNVYSEKDMELAFIKGSENFGRYMATRDIRKINPDVRMVED